MLQDGGRIGFANGAQFDAARRGESISPGTKGRTDPRSGPQIRDDNPFTGGDSRGDSKVVTPRSKPTIKGGSLSSRIKRRFISPTVSFVNFLGDRLGKTKLARINNAIQRQNYINSLDLTDPEQKEEYDRIMSQFSGLGMDIIAGPEDLENTMLSVPPSVLATDPMTQFKTVDGVSTLGDPGVKEILGQGYQDYLNRFEKEDTGRDERPEEITDPCKGPNPPAYCFIGEKADETIKAQRNLAGLTPRIGGSIFNFDTFAADGGRIGAMNGGIMNVEDLDREAFLLGGIAKGLKKAVRGVKKLAKSPIGKAALLGAVGFGIPGVSSGFFSKGLMGTQKGIALKNLLMGKPLGFKTAGDAVARSGGLLDFFKSPMGLITGSSILAGLTTKEDKGDEELAKYLASQKLDPSLSIKGMGSDFNFDFYGAKTQPVADGGRIGYQEGSKEPVAKKTMPLLDMDGMEKDYRETGGFVDMGRMERADDVPARLSKNEFVFTADAVRNAGEGDIDKGAEVMYNMMKNLEAGGEVSEESQGLEGARKMFQTSQRLGEVI